jgi:hypothetical protein
LGNAHTPWDLPAQLEWLEKAESIPSSEQEAKLWIKKILLPTSKKQGLQLLEAEVNKILQVKPISRIKI